MTKGKKTARNSRFGRPAKSTDPVGVRIIGGTFRGRKLEYSGDLRTRPMKDRVREALFNLLGTSVRGKLAIDLFAGTGALALEAISRGALRAVLIERHRPTAQIIGRNAAKLGVDGIVEIVSADTFLWAKRLPALGDLPWLVFCSPPYELYDVRKADTLQMLTSLIGMAPPGSVFVVEFDKRLTVDDLPDSQLWSIREYLPAILAIWEKQAA